MIWLRRADYNNNKYRLVYDVDLPKADDGKAALGPNGDLANCPE